MLGEAAVLGLLSYRRVWRNFPIFYMYVVWELLSDGVTYAAHRSVGGQSSHNYLITYVVLLVVDSALQIGVLIELSWSVLRPIRASLSRYTLLFVGAFIVAAGAALWPFSGLHGLKELVPAYRNLVHVQQTASILRILFFVGLAGCSQMLSIGWRDRELQIATGLGFYSFVSVGVDIFRQHLALEATYRALNKIVVISYLVSLAYWVFSFAQQEAERREFTPQMQSFLLAVAGSARDTRISLSSSGSTKREDRRK
jgi:hypothetical protein